MRALNINKIKRRVKLVPESTIDLINIYRVVEAGDIIYSETSREVKKYRPYGPADSERVKVKVGIEVEKKSADPLMKRVSFLGIVVHADGDLDILKKHHTIHAEKGRDLEIESRERFDRLLSLARSSNRRGAPEFLCISADDENAALIHVAEGGVRILKTVRYARRGKAYDYGVTDDESPLSKIAERISGIMERRRGIEVVLLGPSVVLDILSKELRGRFPNIYKAVKRRIAVSSGGVDGLREAMRSGALGQDLKPLRDAVVVESAIREASSHPERVAMGIEEVYRFVELGYAGLVITTEDYVWSKMDDSKLDKILSVAESGSMRLRIVLSDTEASEKIDSLGGIIAVTRGVLEDD